MTVAELQELASEGLSSPSVELCRALAQGVSDLLDKAPSLPCGDEIRGGTDKDGAFVLVFVDNEQSPEDARGIAVALLRAADEADAARAKEGE